MTRTGLKTIGAFSWAAARVAVREPILYIMIALLGLFWVAVESNGQTERRRDLEAARAQTENLARAFEYHVQRVIEEIDNSVLALRWRLTAALDGEFDFHALAREPGLSSQFVNLIGLVDSDGFLRRTWNGNLLQPLDVRDRLHFTAQRDATGDALFIGPPLLGRSTNMWSVHLSRRIVDRAGQFRGTLVASLDPLKLSNVYESFDLGTSGAITLVGEDMIVRARAPGLVDFLGKPVPASEFSSVLTSARVGFYRTIDSKSGARLVAYRHVPGLPLIVMVSKDESEIIASQTAASRQDRIVAMSITLVVIVLSGFALGYKVRLNEKSIRFRTTLRHMNQGIMIVEADGKLSLINQQAIDLLELPQEFLKNPPSYSEIFSYQLDSGEFGNKAELVDSALYDVVFNQKAVMAETISERTRANGVILEIHTVPLPRGGFLRSFTDITRRRKDEITIRTQIADLERFAHLASHDLQRPLRKIASHTEMLRQSILMDDHRESGHYLDVISAAAERGRTMVADLLRFSKLADGDLKRDGVRLDTMLDALIDDMRGGEATRNARFDNMLPVLTVNCNASLVYQAFQNLLDNAVKYHDPERGIAVRLFGEERSDGYVIHVSDIGVGFDNADKALVFQSFRRLVDGKAVEGTGIGLSLVKAIVEKHGWTIDVDSQSGSGSDFFIFVPKIDLRPAASATKSVAA